MPRLMVCWQEKFHLGEPQGLTIHGCVNGQTEKENMRFFSSRKSGNAPLSPEEAPEAQSENSDSQDNEDQLRAELGAVGAEVMDEARREAIRVENPVGFFERAAQHGARKFNDFIAAVRDRISSNAEWLRRFVREFTPQRTIEEFARRKSELLEAMRKLISEGLEGLRRDRAEVIIRRDEIQPKYDAAKGELDKHVIRMSGNPDSVIEAYTGKALQSVKIVEWTLIAVVSMLEVVAGFVPTQYHTNSWAGLAVAGTIMVALNGGAIITAHLMKRNMTHRKAEDGARTRGLEAYPLNAGDAFLHKFFIVFFFLGLGGLMYWRLIWSQELGESVKVLAILQAILALGLFGTHLYFTSGYRKIDVERWRRQKAAVDQFQAELDALQEPDEFAVRDAIQEEYFKERQELREEILSRLDQFDALRSEYRADMRWIGRMTETAQEWFSAVCDRINVIFAQVTKKPVEYSEKVEQDIGMMLMLRLDRVPEQRDLELLLETFGDPEVELPPDEDSEFDEVWDRAYEEFNRPERMTALPTRRLQIRFAPPSTQS